METLYLQLSALENLSKRTLKFSRCMGRLQMIVVVANRTRENRPSGMKRGACGNVGRMGAGLRPIGKLMDRPPYPKLLHAPHFYPNCRQLPDSDD